jgi:hypothetical protein
MRYNQQVSSLLSLLVFSTCVNHSLSVNQQKMTADELRSTSLHRQLMGRPLVKGMLKAKVFSVTEKKRNGDIWTIWRNNQTKEWASSNGKSKTLGWSIKIGNEPWRKLREGDAWGSRAISIFFDYISSGNLPYGRGGYPYVGDYFSWKSKRVKALTIYWVYGEPMQGAIEMLCDLKTGAPRIITEEHWGLPVDEAETNVKVSKVYLGDVNLKATWPSWAK